MMENKLLKKVWGFLVNPVSVQAPQTKITKKIGNGIINTKTSTNSINNAVKIFFPIGLNDIISGLSCL